MRLLWKTFAKFILRRFQRLFAVKIYSYTKTKRNAPTTHGNNKYGYFYINCAPTLSQAQAHIPNKILNSSFAPSTG